VSKVDEIDAIFLGINCSCLGSFLAIVENDLVVVAAADCCLI
jgi:hypothetical protein